MTALQEFARLQNELQELMLSWSNSCTQAEQYRRRVDALANSEKYKQAKEAALKELQSL